MSEVMEPDIKAVMERKREEFEVWAEAFGAEVNDENFKLYMEMFYE